MELDESALDNVIAGTTEEIATKNALSNEELFRQKKIDDLKKKKQELESLSAEVEKKENISEEEQQEAKKMK